MLDLDRVYAACVVADGAPPYDPRMMLKLLLYRYSTEVTSSREIERRCWGTWPSGGWRQTRSRTTDRLRGSGGST